ncbi:SDR family oxidoreductase [Phenylobacterium sp.]|jgi:NAD(P)-dependent dehydrogenase (short-subunit alcohol dehydrogenase family)|uniref:SDR family oxidoreductase n=1 Tax=Phenylobacterium sp. TaxID=1871053 RepID=UPI002F93A675
MTSASSISPVVVITGASSGIGRATALAFAEQGARLVLAARREPELEAVARSCRELGAQAVVAPADVSSAEDVQRLASQAAQAFGHIDVWINNAGVLHFGRVDETPTEVLDRVLSVNLSGALYGSRAALAHFRRRGRGTLINTGSVLGLVGQPFAAAYIASKFGVRGLSEALRQEVHDQPDIHVCTVMPAAIDTAAYQRAANYMGREMLPIRLLYPPEAVARVCVKLWKRPRREAFAGPAFGLVTATGKALAPALSEWVTEVAARTMEVGSAPRDASEGNLWRPSSDGLDENGGWRRRFARRTPPLTLLGLGLGLGVAGAFALSRTLGNRNAAVTPAA